VAKYGKFDPRNKKRKNDKYRNENKRPKPVSKKRMTIEEYEPEQIKTA